MRMSSLRLCVTACLLLFAAGCDHRTPIPPPQTSDSDRKADVTSAVERSRDSASQRPAGTRDLGAAALSPVDKLFLANAAATGLAEVEAGRLALQKADNPKVKDFARHVIREYTRLNEELRQIAAEKGIGIDREVHGEPRDDLQRLRALSGEEFDAAYVRSFGFEGHKKATALFERQIREGRDAQLKRLAEKALPELRDQHAMAEYLILAASR
jgi:putative membrane protein